MRLTVEPGVVALSPGDVVDLLVRVANDGEDVCTPRLAARGVDPDDVLLPDEVVAVAPGEVMTAIVRVRAAADATPGDQRIAVAAEDLDGLQRPVSATTVLRVGARPDVAVQVEPVATAGRNRAKATTILRNRSDRRLQIGLEASGEGVDVRFRPARIALDPGETRRVRTRIRRSRRSWFAEIRHGAVITARGIGAPASTTLTFTQRPAIPRVAVRGLAAFMALAVWIAATAVVYQRITAEDPVVDTTATAVQPAPPGPGRTSATGLFEEPEPDGVRLPVVIQGTIEGPRDPSGTRVTAERIGFGEQGTTTGLTKVVALTEVKLPRGAVLDKVQVTTDERGRFRIASGLVTDAFYRVTAVRPGFEVASFIVSTSEDAPEITLAFAMDPAPGVLAGRVLDTAGDPVGGATIFVTDGTLSYTTTTASEGLEAGTWTIEGVATPTTYQVLVTRLGFASETLIVEIEGGQSLRDVDAELTADLGTLRGTVRSVDPATGQTIGAGGIDITLAGPEARTTRTITAPDALRGGFTFPALPYGTYELTFSAPGWSTRVAEVTVDRGDVVLDVSDLVRSSGVIQGRVWQTVFGSTADVTDTDCRYPRLAQRDELETLPRPCGGVSVSVTDEDGNLFATASATGTGFFQVDGVPAGEYSVRLSRAGYVDHIERVVLRAGGLVDLTPPDPVTEAVAPIELRLRPALAACLGTVELTVSQRGAGPVVVGPENVPTEIVSGSTATGIRIGLPSFECEDGQPAPQWSRVGGNLYRITNVPLGQTPMVVDFLGFGPEERILAVTPEGFARATVLVSPEPRDITGTIRVLSGGAGAQRNAITVSLLDRFDAPVTGKSVTVDATTSVDLGGGDLVSEVIFTVPRVDVDEDYSLAISGAGVVAATTSQFRLTAGGTPFEVARQDLQARTTVTGTVRGFTVSGASLVPDDLSGATITFTPVGGSALAPLTSGSGGSFSLELDAGRYDVTVAAAGYATRTFSSIALIGTAASPTQQLQATDRPYAVYPDIVGNAGEVGLVPTARTVQVDVTLDGAASASRAARVELVGGTIGGVPTTTPTHAESRTIVVGEPTTSGRFTFTGVPAGAYTLNVVPTDGAAEGITHTASAVVVGPVAGAGQLDVSATAQAMSRITGRVVGFDVFTMTLEALEAATVLADGTSASTGGGGEFSFVVRSGTYGAGGDFGAVSITPPSGSGYAVRSVSGTVSDLVGVLPDITPSSGLFLVYPDLAGGDAGDVGLDPSPRRVEVAVDLRGFTSTTGSTTRDLVVRLVDGQVSLEGSSQALSDVSLSAASAATVTAGTAETFLSTSVRPGTYELDIAVASGTRVILEALVSDAAASARVRQGSGTDAGKWFVDIQPGTATVGLTATVQARTVVSGTVFGFDSALDPVELDGATLTLPARARATAPGGSAVVTSISTASDGEFAVEVDSDDYSTGDAITFSASGFATRTLAPVLAGGAASLLTGASSPDDRPFTPNPGLVGLAGVGAGDVVLVPLPRDVVVDLSLLGEVGAARTVTVELTGGELGGAATDPAVVTAGGSPITLTVSDPATTGQVTFADVPVGAFTLEITGDDVRPVSEPLLVPPGSGPLTTSADVRATVAVAFDVSETIVVAGEAVPASPTAVAGATIAATAASGVDASGVTVSDGSVTLTLDSGIEYDVAVTRQGAASPDLTAKVTPGSGVTEPISYTLPAGGLLRLIGEVSASVQSVRVADDATGEPGTLLGEATNLETAASKTYAIDGLPVDKVLRVEFYGTSDASGTPLVSRWVQVAATGNFTIVLDQNAEIEDVGTLTVELAVGQDPDASADQTRDVRVTLVENLPSAFFSIGPSGSEVRTITVSATGSDLDVPMTGTVVFSGIPVADSSPSLSENRLTLLVEILGSDSAAYVWTVNPDPATPGVANIPPFDLTVGSGVAAEKTQAVTFVRAPGAVQGLAATVQEPGNTVGSGEVELDWTSPAGNGGGAIEYVVTYGSGTSAAGCSPTTSTTCRITGLTNGTSETFSVVARNSAITSLVSGAQTVSATPRTVPGAPQSLTLDSATTTSLSVSWTAPSSDGGDPITSYTATATASGQTTRSCTTTGSPPATNCTISSLSSGTSYTVTVTATNGAGTGAGASQNFSTVADSLLALASTGGYQVARSGGSSSGTYVERGWFFKVDREVTVDELYGGGAAGPSWILRLREAGTGATPSTGGTVLGTATVAGIACETLSLPGDKITVGSSVGTVKLFPGTWYAVTSQDESNTGPHCNAASDTEAAFGAAGTSTRRFGGTPGVPVGFRVSSIP